MQNRPENYWTPSRSKRSYSSIIGDKERPTTAEFEAYLEPRPLRHAGSLAGHADPEHRLLQADVYNRGGYGHPAHLPLTNRCLALAALG